jgi:hypothetical protein
MRVDTAIIPRRVVREVRGMTNEDLSRALRSYADAAAVASSDAAWSLIVEAANRLNPARDPIPAGRCLTCDGERVFGQVCCEACSAPDPHPFGGGVVLDPGEFGGSDF